MQCENRPYRVIPSNGVLQWLPPAYPASNQRWFAYPGTSAVDQNVPPHDPNNNDGVSPAYPVRTIALSGSFPPYRSRYLFLSPFITGGGFGNGDTQTVLFTPPDGVTYTITAPINAVNPVPIYLEMESGYQPQAGDLFTWQFVSVSSKFTPAAQQHISNTPMNSYGFFTGFPPPLVGS